MKAAVKNVIDAMHRVDPLARLEARLWDDERISVGGSPAEVTVWFKTKEAAQRTFADGFLGFGESYMSRDIEVEGDMSLLFRLGHQIDFGDMTLSTFEKLRFAALFLINQNTLRGSKKNVAHHYNLGNDFYELFLDETMGYTCAYFKTPDDTLQQAQTNKFDHICRKLMLKPGERLVDLGCGWGGLLIHAATHYGITGVGATLSKPQADYANERFAKLGLADKIKVLHSDYREVPGEGTFDKAASVGMLEHVGKRFIPTCIQKLHDLMKPGGVCLLHAIMNDTPYPDDPWTMKYIFPGTHVPAVSYVIQEIAKRKLSIMDVENLRQHYGRTIDLWHENFERNYEEVQKRFGDSFARSWRLYWVVSSTSFKYGGNRLFQIQFSRGLNNDLPWTRDYMYK